VHTYRRTGRGKARFTRLSAEAWIGQNIIQGAPGSDRTIRTIPIQQGTAYAQTTLKGQGNEREGKRRKKIRNGLDESPLDACLLSCLLTCRPLFSWLDDVVQQYGVHGMQVAAVY
jgi:hypothetical protein